MSKIEVKILPKNALGSTGFEAEMEGEFPGGESYTAGAGMSISAEKVIASKLGEVPTQEGLYLVSVNAQGQASIAPYVAPTPYNPHAVLNEEEFNFDGEAHELTQAQKEMLLGTVNKVFVNNNNIFTSLSAEDIENGTGELQYGYVDYEVSSESVAISSFAKTTISLSKVGDVVKYTANLSEY